MAETLKQPGAVPAASLPPPLRVQIPSPIGPLGLELIGEALTRVVIGPKGADRRAFPPFETVGRSDFLDEVVGRVSEFFAGARRQLDIDYDLGLARVSGFQRRVLKETAKIPYGKTRTYQQIAEASGNSDAYRQVLACLLSNPLPIVVPCHRVVTSKSGVGSFVAGSKKKAWLLKLERSNLTEAKLRPS